MTLYIELAGLIVAVATILSRLNVALMRLEARLTSIEATIKANHDMAGMQISALEEHRDDHEARLRCLESQVFRSVILPSGGAPGANGAQAPAPSGHPEGH